MEVAGGTVKSWDAASGSVPHAAMPRPDPARVRSERIQLVVWVMAIAGGVALYWAWQGKAMDGVALLVGTALLMVAVAGFYWFRHERRR